MIDDLKLEMPCFLLNEQRLNELKPFSWGAIIFSPAYNSDGECYYFKSKLKNLHLKICPGRLIIENSIHKFFKGNNYSDFPMCQVHDCLYQLAEILGFEFWDATITKLTTSINLQCDAEKYIDKLQTYKGYPMEPMRPRNSRKVYGKKFSASKYIIKVYDKAKSEKIENGLKIEPTIRIESEMYLSYVKKRSNNSIVIHTPKDLFNASVIESLARELNMVVDHLGFTTGLNPMAAKCFNDAQIILTINDQKGRMMLKNMADFRTKRRYENRYQALTTEFGVTDMQKELKILLKDKLEILMFG